MPKGLVLNVDTTKSEFQNPMVELRQGDGNYQSLYVTVTDNGDPFDLTGWIISFMGTTAGSHKIVDASVTLDSTVVGAFTYTPTKAWGQDEGEFKNAYFKFVKNDETASGASFRVNVLNAVDLTDEEAQDYISVVDDMIVQVKTDMDTKLTETKQTLADTQSQANTVQTNVNDLNTNVNDLKAQNNNIKTSDNTWTGNNTFTQPINGMFATKIVDETDYNDVAKNMYKYSGIGIISGTPLENSPADGATGYLIQTMPGGVPDSGYIQAYIRGITYGTGVNQGEIQGWTELADNSKVVHNTGTETVAGNKTFTGNETFTNLINGSFNSTRFVPFTDFADVANFNMIKYSGLWFNQFTDIKNAPTGGDVYWASIEVLPTSSSSGFIKVTYQITGDVYITGVDNFALKGWYKVANDSTIVHNTGTETIAGDKTFTGLTDIKNQKQYKSSFTIGSNTINLTRLGSMVFFNTVTNADIAGGTSAGSIPAGFTPAGDTVFVGVAGTSISYMLFQSSKSVWIPSTVISTSRFGGTYLTNDPLPS